MEIVRIYQYYTRDDLNIGRINDTLHRRYFRYTAHISARPITEVQIRLYCVVLITSISHGVRELQRSLQFRSVDNHRTVARYFFDSRGKSFSGARISLGQVN